MASHAPSPAQIRKQLEKILSSRIFNAAGRAHRFLEVVVNQTLEGKHDQIKEYLLGVEVFDRAESFDPKLDTIVRVEAGKLRKRLHEYYETKFPTVATFPRSRHGTPSRLPPPPCARVGNLPPSPSCCWPRASPSAR